MIFSLILLRNAMLAGNMFRGSWNFKNDNKYYVAQALWFVSCSSNDKTRKPSGGDICKTLYIYNATSTGYCATPRPEENIDVASGTARRDVAPYEHASQWSPKRTAGARGRVPLTSVKEPLKYRVTAGFSLVTPRRSYTFLPVKFCRIASW